VNKDIRYREELSVNVNLTV